MVFVEMKKRKSKTTLDSRDPILELACGGDDSALVMWHGVGENRPFSKTLSRNADGVVPMQGT